MTHSELIDPLTGLLAGFCDANGILGEPDASGMHEALWRELESAGYCDPQNFGVADPLPQLVEVLRVLGAHGASVPYAESVVLAPVLVPRSEAGEGYATVADGLRGGTLRMEASAGRLGLSGRVGAVPYLRTAARLVVLGARGGTAAAALVEPSSIAVETAENMAGEARDSALLRNVPAVEAACNPCPPELVDSWRARGWIASAASIAGALDKVARLSTDFAKERKQFGKPISQFQAIQHHLAALASEAAITAAAVTRAARLLVEDGNLLGAAAARIRAGAAAGKAARIAHQVHGTIGFTAEYPLERLTRRLWSWRDDYGTERELSEWLGHRIVQAGAQQAWPLISAGGLVAEGDAGAPG